MIQLLTESKSKINKQIHAKLFENDLPKFEFKCRLVSELEELEELAEQWNRLHDVCLKPNPFMDPNFLIPAIRHLSNPGSVSVLVVEAPNRRNVKAPKVLCALMPLIKRRMYGIPQKCFEIWKHDFCYDSTPLIREDCGKGAFSAALDFLGGDLNAKMFSMDTVSGQGKFQNLVTDLIYERSHGVFSRDAFTRACFIPDTDAEFYIRKNVSKNTRKNATRMEAQLEELGTLEHQTVEDGSLGDHWIDEFLEIEASGWKGKDGTAMLSDPSTKRFFKEMAQLHLANGSLSLLKVSLDKHPIAMLCNLQRGGYAVAFKTAYDENYGQYSPGVIAELKSIERYYADGIEKLDSCATPDHTMINRIWSDRTRMQSIVMSLGGSLSKLAVASLPFLQAFSKLIRGEKKQ